MLFSQYICELVFSEGVETLTCYNVRKINSGPLALDEAIVVTNCSETDTGCVLVKATLEGDSLIIPQREFCCSLANTTLPDTYIMSEVFGCIKRTSLTNLQTTQNIRRIPDICELHICILAVWPGGI